MKYWLTDSLLMLFFFHLIYCISMYLRLQPLPQSSLCCLCMSEHSTKQLQGASETIENVNQVVKATRAKTEL